MIAMQTRRHMSKACHGKSTSPTSRSSLWKSDIDRAAVRKTRHHDKFGEPAMTLAAIDQVVHHSTILEMNIDSYRRRAAFDQKRGHGLLREHATIKDVEAAKTD